MLSKVLFLVSSLSIVSIDSEFQLQILHNNDMHAQYDEANINSGPCSEEEKRMQQCYGGFARTRAALSIAVEEAKARDIPSLLLNGGDSFPGTPYYEKKKWEIAAPLVDALGFDVTTLGNHEFDDGIDNLVNFINNIKTPVVCCNLDLDTEPRLRLPNLTRSIVRTIEGNKIGIIGSVTPITMRSSRTENLKILDEIECIRAETERLKKSDVNIIISLSHSGFDIDIKIAEAIPDLSLIVGSHTHTLLYSPIDKAPSIEKPGGVYPFMVKHASGKKIPIVQAFAFTKYLGKLMVTFDDNGAVVSASGNPQLLDSTIPGDETMKAIVDSWLRPIETFAKTVVAYTRFPLEHADFINREFESALGNLVADALLDFAVSEAFTSDNEYWTIASIGMTNKFSVRGGLGNKGMKVVGDLSKPTYSRVESVRVLCAKCIIPKYEELDDDRVYAIIMPRFLVGRSSTYSMLKTTAMNITNLGKTHSQVLHSYLEKLEKVYPFLDDRIIVENKWYSEA